MCNSYCKGVHLLDNTDANWYAFYRVSQHRIQGLNESVEYTDPHPNRSELRPTDGAVWRKLHFLHLFEDKGFNFLWL